MVRGRNAQSSNAVADFLENHRNQPLDILSIGGPVVSAVGAHIPPPIGVTIGMPPQAPVQPIALTVGIEAIHVWQQR